MCILLDTRQTDRVTLKRTVKTKVKQKTKYQLHIISRKSVMCSHVSHNDKSINDQMKNVASGSIAPALVAIGAPSGSEKSYFNNKICV